jgi:hypothetical protein
LKDKLIFRALIAFIIFIIIYLEFKINTDLSFHQGKDEGFFIRIEAICILSTIFYFVMAQKKKLLMIFLGFLIGVFSIVSSYLICLLIIEFRYYASVFHILSTLIYIRSFFFVEKKLNNPDGSDMSTQR